MSFLKPKIPKIKPPAPPPTPADTRTIDELDPKRVGYQSLIATSPSGLKRKSNTAKRSLLGGAGA